jgi:hypothetical protein
MVQRSSAYCMLTVVETNKVVKIHVRTLPRQFSLLLKLKKKSHIYTLEIK